MHLPAMRDGALSHSNPSTAIQSNSGIETGFGPFHSYTLTFILTLTLIVNLARKRHLSMTLLIQ